MGKFICPHCESVPRHPIGTLKDGDELHCPNCGSTTTLRLRRDPNEIPNDEVVQALVVAHDALKAGVEGLAEHFEKRCDRLNQGLTED